MRRGAIRQGGSVVPGREFLRGGERRDELGAQVRDGRQQDGRSIGDGPLVIGQRKPDTASAKLIEQIGHPVRVLGRSGQRLLGGRGREIRLELTPADGPGPHERAAM